MVGGVVLAGGAGRRMGGIDKAALMVDGVTLLDRVLRAARPVCDHLVVVGPARPTVVDGVGFVVEEQPGGGPVPAVRAGLDAIEGGACGIVFVLASDLPLLRSRHLRRLLAALDDPDVGAVAAIDAGGLNPLLAAYRVDVLRAAASDAGVPAKRLLPSHTLAVDLGPDATLNVNRPADLGEAEHRLVIPS